MATYIYPTAAELQEIEQSLLPVLTQDDELFSILKIENHDSDLILWEQESDYTGLQSARSLNAAGSKVDPAGVRRYSMQPGYYHEWASIDEQELTRRRKMGSFNQNVDISDLVRKRQDQLLSRRINRIRKIGWDLLANGTFSVAAPNGQVLHTDTYTTQTFNASVGWATAATSTPLADFRAVQLKHRGYSVSFGSDAKAFMNLQTWQYMVANSNSADLYGRRTQGLGTVNNIGDVNKLLMGDNLPEIVIYDKGYKADSSDTDGTRFIPDNVVVVVGVRDDKRPIGGYAMTRNAANPNMAPGPFTTVVDQADFGRPVPRLIEVHDSHNGGPILYFGEAVVIMSVD